MGPDFNRKRFFLGRSRSLGGLAWLWVRDFFGFFGALKKGDFFGDHPKKGPRRWRRAVTVGTANAFRCRLCGFPSLEPLTADRRLFLGARQKSPFAPWRIQESPSAGCFCLPPLAPLLYIAVGGAPRARGSDGRPALSARKKERFAPCSPCSACDREKIFRSNSPSPREFRRDENFGLEVLGHSLVKSS